MKLSEMIASAKVDKATLKKEERDTLDALDTADNDLYDESGAGFSPKDKAELQEVLRILKELKGIGGKSHIYISRSKQNDTKVATKDAVRK